jgi:hypothetical protein
MQHASARHGHACGKVLHGTVMQCPCARASKGAAAADGGMHCWCAWHALQSRVACIAAAASLRAVSAPGRAAVRHACMHMHADCARRCGDACSGSMRCQCACSLSVGREAQCGALGLHRSWAKRCRRHRCVAHCVGSPAMRMPSRQSCAHREHAGKHGHVCRHRKVGNSAHHAGTANASQQPRRHQGCARIMHGCHELVALLLCAAQQQVWHTLRFAAVRVSGRGWQKGRKACTLCAASCGDSGSSVELQASTRSQVRLQQLEAQAYASSCAPTGSWSGAALTEWISICLRS